VHVLGRLMVDGGGLGDDDDFYKNDNAAELRAARLGLEGHFLQGWKYKFETDFADSTVDVKDAYLEYSGEFVEPAYVRIGQYKTPNSLEEVTSRRFITFMERAAIVDAFELDYQLGLGGGVSGDNWGADAGLFGQNASDVQDNEGYALARPVSLQSEFANTVLQRKNGEDDANNLWGGYVSASYFLTGEHRNYDPERGVFERIEVARPLQDGGPGAWELTARADYIDLNNEGVKGGEQVSWIAGVNWYANDYVRLMLDGAVTQVFDAGNSDAAADGNNNLIYGAGMRAQVDW
jgi:phosphate-selective porin